MKSFLITALGIYAVLVATVYLLQRRMMYFPDPSMPNLAGHAAAPDMREVTMTTADGLTLGAGYQPPAGENAPVLVYFHGNAGHHGYRLPLIAPYAAAGFGVMLASYRGYGGNPGSPGEDGLYEDGRAALAWLEGQGIAPNRVVLYGESLGSGVAVHLAEAWRAAGKPLGAVVLQAPFSSITDVAAHHYWYLPVRLLIRDRYEIEGKVGAIGAPLLVLYSQADTVVPPRYSKRLFDAAAEPKELRDYPRAGHNGFDMTNAANDVVEFIRRHLSK